MIKKLLLTLLLATATLGLCAQSANDMRTLSARADQVKAMKIGYMTEQMKLTSQQSAAFWPLYNEYWTARYELFECKRKAQEKISSSIATQSDINELIRVEAEQANLMKLYATRFAKVLSVDQVAKMFVSEEDFKSVLLKSLK